MSYPRFLALPVRHIGAAAHTVRCVLLLLLLLQAATWFVENELSKVADFVRARPGYELLLVGHSLGAGESRCWVGVGGWGAGVCVWGGGCRGWLCRPQEG
jgi:hypothetical protein